MWRDILIILCSVLTVLMFFGLTGPRLSGYAKTAGSDIAKKSPRQKRYLFVAIAVTPLYIFFAIWEVDTIGLVTSLIFIALVIFLWGGTLIRVWKLSERGEKIAKGMQAVALAALLSLLIIGTILSDAPLWRKIVYPLVGAGGGYGMHILSKYMRKNVRMNASLKKETTNENHTTTK